MTGPKPIPLDQRLLSHFIVDANGCWIWTASLTSSGYGNLRIKGRFATAHRVSYEVHIGPIPDGMQLDHLCRVRRCINPAHLEPVEGIENFARGLAPGAVALRTGYCQRGHEFAGDNIYVYPSGRRQCRPCMAAKNRESRERRDAS